MSIEVALKDDVLAKNIIQSTFFRRRDFFRKFFQIVFLGVREEFPDPSKTESSLS